MANSKLLKEAIADAKAVKETALANAKLALEEAFTPRLQSVLAAKLQAEAQKEEEEEMKNEELKSSEVGKADTSGHNPGKVPALKADTDVEAGQVKQTSAGAAAINHDYTKTKDISENWEEEGKEESVANEIAALEARLAELKGMEDEANHFGQEEESYEEEGENPFAGGDDDSMGDDNMGSDDMGGDDDQMGGDDQDDMDLEAIIRELEAQLEGSEEEEESTMYEAEEEEEESKNESYSDGSDAGTDKSEDPKVVMNNEGEDVTKASGKAPRGSFDKDSISEDVIDLEEILREMEADMKDGDKEEEKKDEAVQAELNEAYETIKSLQKTINEVNLLNAKLLFANKLFRAHNMTNEQKVKVIETLDRTNSVREVKLVYATLAENFKYSSPVQKSVKKSITEGIASKVVKSTAPKSEAKQVIAESADFADRFKKLAGIIK